MDFVYNSRRPYNLTYFIRLFAVATFADYKITTFNRKPYKMFYIGGFIRKTIKENISSKEFKKLIIRLLVRFKAGMYIMFVE